MESLRQPPSLTPDEPASTGTAPRQEGAPALADILEASPRMTLQRQQIQALFGGAAAMPVARNPVAQLVAIKVTTTENLKDWVKTLKNPEIRYAADVNDQGTLSSPLTVVDVQGLIKTQLNAPPTLTLSTLIPTPLKAVGTHGLTLTWGKQNKTIKISFIIEKKVIPETDEQKAERERLERRRLHARGDEALPEPANDVSEGGLFGTEFTFTSDTLYQAGALAQDDGVQYAKTPAAVAIQQKWLDRMLLNKPPDLAHYEQLDDKSGNPSIRFTYTDGFWYQCSLDICCIETQTCRMSLADAKKKGWLLRLQRDIFDVATALGLHVDPFVGGGHLHLDVASTFGNDESLFRAFVVDFCNHPLAMEALENDPTSAPVVAQLIETHRGNFDGVITKFDTLMARGEDHRSGADKIVHLAGKIEADVYRLREDLDPPERYHALNMRRIVDPNVLAKDRTLELRALRAQRNAAEFVRIAELFQARIAMLKALILDNQAPKLQKVARPKENSALDAVLLDFKAYVEGAHLVWADYEPLARANMGERTVGEQPKYRPKKDLRLVDPVYPEKPLASASSSASESGEASDEGSGTRTEVTI